MADLITELMRSGLTKEEAEAEKDKLIKQLDKFIDEKTKGSQVGKKPKGII